MKRTFKFLTAITLTLLLVFGGTLSAFAQPFSEVNGNSYKIDDIDTLQKNTTYTYSAYNNQSQLIFRVNIYIYTYLGSEYLTWWTPSPFTVNQVAVKGGPGAPNVYNYSASSGSNWLHAPFNFNSMKYYGISHIVFNADPVFIPNPALTIDKSALESEVYPGETIHYTITVTNTGNVDLSNINVVDPLIDLDETINLNVGANQSFNGSYIVPLDYDSDVVNNTATASTTYDNQPLSVNDSVQVDVLEPPFVPAPGLSLVKEATESFAYPGDTINFTITITNTGNVPLTNVSLVDPLIPSVNETFDLALGGVKVVNASYVIPEDFDGVSVTNIATASAVYEQEALSATDDAVVPVYPVPVDPVYDISLTKLSNVTSTVQGGVIQFTLTVENTGTTTLFDVVLNDPLLGLVVEIGTLEKGDIWSNTYPYNVPANATGNVVNEADVIGYYYLQDESTESVTDDAIVTVPIIIPVDPDPEDPDPVDPDPSDPDPILGTVIVSYVDTEGNTLSPSFSFTGEVGTNYGTSARIIDGFSLVETPSNASGSFINGTINVIYVYDNGSSEPEILELDLDETPLGPATPEPVDSSLPPDEPLEEPIDEIILLQEEVPLGDGLPQTGQLPSLLFYGLGSVISLMGVSLKKFKR